MAVSRGHSSEIPKDAVRITQDEALLYQWKIISGWDKWNEVWALKHAPTATAVMTGVTSIFVNNHFRSKLKLGRYGQMSTYLPIVVIPAMLSMFTHKLRATVFQAGTGVVYPMLLAPLSSCMMATRYFTYRLPSITEKPKEVLFFIQKLARPILPTMGIVLGVQSLVTMYLTFKEMEQNLSIQLQMKKLEQSAEEDFSNIE